MDPRIYRFSPGLCDWYEQSPASCYSANDLLGGKGAGLVDMCQLGLPIPPGFTITTANCKALYKLKGGDAVEFLNNLMHEVMEHMDWLSGEFGYMPLVSVRSGAPISMPGMMDTILNVGLTTYNVDEWGTRIGERAAFDSWRRLKQMLGESAFGIPKAVYEHELQAMKDGQTKQEMKKSDGKPCEKDTDLNVAALKALCFMLDQKFKAVKQQEFPNDLETQLRAAIAAVFDSWMSPRAIEYRKLNNISGDMGTAVNVQAMVFGNMGDDSGSGVAFTRNPSTGDIFPMGEYLPNAQGEDVVAGIRTPEPLVVMADPKSQEQPPYIAAYGPDPEAPPALQGGSLSGKTPWAAQLLDVFDKLEQHYRDMVDIEFTVQQGKLWLLQSRVGKRSARAAFKIAHDMVTRKAITKEEALKRLTVEQFKAVRRPAIDPKFKTPPHLVGLPACPGVAVGRPVFTAKEAVNCKEPCILVTHETTPEDIAGMAKAVGILTRVGGTTSHAAVVARAMDKPCVVGCTTMSVEVLKVPHTVAKITIDGSTGNVWLNADVPVIDSSDAPDVKEVMQWCMDKVGGAEVYVVDPQEEIARPYRIAVAAWWGDADVLEVVLDSLEGKPKLDHVSLDLTSPWELVPAADALLETVFSANADHVGFSKIIWDELEKRKGKLKGLVLLGIKGHDAQISLLRSWGYVVPTSPQTVADLMTGAVGEPSTEFIEKVIGGTDAWEKVREALKAAGHKMGSVPPAVPVDYAAFTVLSR